MAVIGTIRQKFGILLIVIVGVALAAFVLGDLFRARPQRQEVFMGEVGDEKISYKDFDAKFEVNKSNQMQQQQKTNLTADEIFRVKESTWKQIVNDLLLQDEYEKIGLAVSTDELFDQIQGDKPHPWIERYFKDETTNQYDPELVRTYLKQLENMTSDQKQQWFLFEQSIKENRVKTKYGNLISKSYFVPDTLLQKNFNEQRTTANIRLVALSSAKIDDSLVEVTDKEIEAYYEAHKNKYYKDSPTRDIEYVIFDVRPSADDRARIETQVMNIFNEFKSTEEPFVFAHYESNNSIDSSYRKAADLPVNILAQIENAEAGTFVKPYVEDEAWHMAKLVDTQERPDSLNAKHILIAYAGAYGTSPDVTRLSITAEALADSLMSVASKSNFETLAKAFSDDPSAAQNSGDLGWFADGDMVPEFNNAVLNGEEGDILKVETQFGYHIILHGGKKDFNKKYKIAQIDISIEPSDETNQQVYALASEFKIKANEGTAFDTLVDQFNLSKRNVPFISPMQNAITGLQYGRGLVQWAFRDESEVGTVSDIFEQEEDKFIIAVVSKIAEVGYTPLEEVKLNIEPLIRKEKKIAMLCDQLKASMKSAKSIDEIASSYSVKVDTVKMVNFSMRTIGRFGAEEKVIAKAFDLKKGVVSQPIQGNNHAFIMIVDEVIPAPGQSDYSSIERQLRNPIDNAVRSEGYIKMLEENTNFVDNRKLFY